MLKWLILDFMRNELLVWETTYLGLFLGDRVHGKSQWNAWESKGEGIGQINVLIRG